MIELPPKPRILWGDIKSFFARGERHNLLALIPAMLIPAGIFYIFVLDAETNIVDDEPVIIYAESWPLDRSDAEIIERQRVLALERNEQIAQRRERFQEAADALGVDYDREAAAEADRITEENRRTLSRPIDTARDGEEAGSREEPAGEAMDDPAETDAAGR